MDLQSGIPFYIYMANISAKARSLPKHMIVASATNALMYIVHGQIDETGTRVKARVKNMAHADKEF